MDQVFHHSAVGNKDIDLSWMIGRVISSVTFHEPELWYFSFEPGVNIGVQCLWRIVEKNGLVLTGEDHGHRFGLPAPVDAAAKSTEFLASRKIVAVKMLEATADIFIEFTDNLRLEIITNSIGYENWQLCDPLGREYFAQGGRLTREASPSAP